MRSKFALGIAALILLTALVSCATAPEQTPSEAPSATPASASTPAPTSTPTPSPTPTPTPTPEPVDQIKERIAAMTDEELVGQMVMCGFTGSGKKTATYTNEAGEQVTGQTSDLTKAPQEFKDLVSQYKVGNVILFGQNTDTFEQTAALIADIKSANLTDIDLSFSIDVEGGSVRRFRWDPKIKSAQKLGQEDDPDATYEQFLRIGAKLQEIGITIDLAPVLDIADNPENTFLGNRMFGSDPEKAIPHIQAAVRGLQDGGILSFGKHFPGHGNTATDSHKQLPTLTPTLDELKNHELTMFSSAVEAGIDGMLVGHLSYPNVDPAHITSVSDIFITDILRQEMGFSGVIMSDDMRMSAIAGTVGIGEGAVQFIEAGGDLVLIGKSISKQREVFTSIYEALASGRLTRERLEESVYRILVMKGYETY